MSKFFRFSRPSTVHKRKIVICIHGQHTVNLSVCWQFHCCVLLSTKSAVLCKFVRCFREMAAVIVTAEGKTIKRQFPDKGNTMEDKGELAGQKQHLSQYKGQSKTVIKTVESQYCGLTGVLRRNDFAARYNQKHEWRVANALHYHNLHNNNNRKNRRSILEAYIFLFYFGHLSL